MILVVNVLNCLNPIVMDKFEYSEQALKDAKTMCDIYHRKDDGNYKVFISLDNFQENK